MAPTLNAKINIHKENNPIRTVINNMQAPTYKLAKYMTEKITELIQLQYTFVASNSTKVANDISQIKIKSNYKLVIFDIKNLYVNIPIRDMLLITE
jgi:hypothetical protein